MPPRYNLIFRLILTISFMFSLTLSGQNETSKLYSNSIVEYVFNYNSNQYEKVFTTDTISEFIFIGDTMYFRKFEDGMWLANVLTIDTIFLNNNGVNQFFKDDYGQLIQIVKDKEALIWYHNKDQQTDTYFRRTVYNGLNERPSKREFEDLIYIKIFEASINGVDQSELFVQENAQCVFLKERNDSVSLVLLREPEEKSMNGYVHVERLMTIPEAPNYARTEVLRFVWSNIIGPEKITKAECLLTKSYMEDGYTPVELEIKGEDGSIWILNGLIITDAEYEDFLK